VQQNECDRHIRCVSFSFAASSGALTNAKPCKG
jgi:hypothetical protein